MLSSSALLTLDFGFVPQIVLDGARESDLSETAGIGFVPSFAPGGSSGGRPAFSVRMSASDFLGRLQELWTLPALGTCGCPPVRFFGIFVTVGAEASEFTSTLHEVRSFRKMAIPETVQGLACKGRLAHCLRRPALGRDGSLGFLYACLGHAPIP